MNVFRAEGGRKTPLSSRLLWLSKRCCLWVPVKPMVPLLSACAGEIFKDTSQPSAFIQNGWDQKKRALGGMWRETRPLGLCCIVIEASQVLQTGPVTELVLVLEGGRTGQ